MRTVRLLIAVLAASTPITAQPYATIDPANEPGAVEPVQGRTGDKLREQSTGGPVQQQDAVEPAQAWLCVHRAAGAALAADMSSAAKDPARFVIVGCAFEGVTEITRFENDVCAAAKGFDVVAVDVGFAEGEAADAWIRTGQGDVGAIATSFGAWGWDHAGAVAFLEALHARPEKPLFAGIGVGDPQPLLEPFLAYVKKVYPEGFQRTQLVLDSFRKPARGGRPHYWSLDDNERGVMRYGVDELNSVLHDQQETFVAHSSAAEFARALRIVAVFSQYELTMRFEHEGGDADPRGRILADNTLALATLDGKPRRVLAFVGVRDLGRASDADTFAARLARGSGTQPVCIATACGAGSFLAFDPNDRGEGDRVPRKVELAADARTPLEKMLAGCGEGDATFDLRPIAKDSAASKWLTQRRTLRSARATCGGANETPWDYAIAADFDALVWFPSVTAAALSATSSR